jgi:hypothetical protein|tara:strand:- start:248 stop:433 length:186 start_codon:yes stop_codon:yes gene_type:complete
MENVLSESESLSSQRLAFEVDQVGSIEVDSSTGNLYLEAFILVSIIAVLYIGKKVVDKVLK